MAKRAQRHPQPVVPMWWPDQPAATALDVSGDKRGDNAAAEPRSAEVLGWQGAGQGDERVDEAATQLIPAAGRRGFGLARMATQQPASTAPTGRGHVDDRDTDEGDGESSVSEHASTGLPEESSATMWPVGERSAQPTANGTATTTASHETEPGRAPDHRPPCSPGVAPGSGASAAAAAQCAALFGMDYLSWNENDPSRRALALKRFAPIGAEPVDAWSGRGYQRATYAATGDVIADRGDPSLWWVDVWVSVIPYRRCVPDQPGCPIAPPTVPPGEMASSPSCAPAPDDPGWKALDSEWINLSVPVRQLGSGRLVIDPTAEDGERDRSEAGDPDADERQGA